MTHYFDLPPGGLPHLSPDRNRILQMVAEPFRLCLKSEPDAFLVADGEKEGVVGYIFAPAHTNRLWRVALCHGFLFRWFWRWVTGRYGIGLSPVRALAVNKLDFLTSSHNREKGPSVQARILSIAVHPEHQGQGIATALCRRGLARLDSLGVRPVRLEVRPENLPAVRLYTGLEFRQVGETADSQGTWLIMLRG